MIKLVVFDLAGTVIDEKNTVYKSLYKSILRAGLDVTYPLVLKIGAGKEKKQAIIDIVKYVSGEADPVFIDSIFDDFKNVLKLEYENLEVQPQPGADALFQRLKETDVRIAFNTGYDRSTTESLLEKLKWKKEVTFDALVTASDVHQGRPQPDMILKAMEELNITDPGSVVKIGDSVIDITEGKNAGCLYTIGITTGAHTAEQLSEAEPTHIIDHLGELAFIIEEV